MHIGRIQWAKTSKLRPRIRVRQIQSLILLRYTRIVKEILNLRLQNSAYLEKEWEPLKSLSGFSPQIFACMHDL